MNILPVAETVIRLVAMTALHVDGIAAVLSTVLASAVVMLRLSPILVVIGVGILPGENCKR